MNKRKCYSILLTGLVLLLASSTVGCSGPVFEVSNLTVDPAEVVLGNSVSVSVDVENIGHTQGTYTVTLEVDAVAKMTKEITLDANTLETVSFVVTEGLGTHSVTADGLATEFEVTRAWRVTVLSLEKETGPVPLAETLGKHQSIQPNAGYTFILVEIEFERIQPGKCELRTGWVVLSDSTGKSYSPVATESQMLGGFIRKSLTIKKMKGPPWVITQTFLYSVPSDAKGFMLNFLDYPPIDLEL